MPDIATIKSLSLVTIKGYIENNEQNGILEEFNGFIYVTVYDKEKPFTLYPTEEMCHLRIR